MAALGRSGAIGAGAAAIAVLVGVPVAWVLSRQPRWFWPLAVCALPLALPPSAAVSGWLRWLAPGNVSSAFQSLALGMGVPGPLFSVPGAALVLGLGLWPIVTFEVWPAFVRARGDAYAAALLCSSRSRAFFRVVLPMSYGELGAGALLVFLLGASDFTVSSLLLVRTLPIEVHDQLAVRRLGAAAWTALPWLLVAASAAWLLMRARRASSQAEHPASGAPPIGGPARLGHAALCVGVLGGFAVPLAGCAAGAFAGDRPAGLAFASGVPYLWVSLRLAAAVAMLAAVLGALRVILWPQNTCAPLLWSALLLLAVPGSLVACGLLATEVQARSWLVSIGGQGAELSRVLPGSLVLACGYLLRFLYLPLRLSEEGLRGLDPAILESAETAGHGRVSRGLNIALPLVWRHLLAAAGLVFVLALGELPLSDQLAPPGGVPLPVWLFSQQHYGYTDDVFAASLLAGLVAMAGVILAGAAVHMTRAGEGRQ